VKPNVDFGRLTQEETAELAVEALNELTLDNRVQAVLKAFEKDERDELANWLGDEETKEEQSR
jgi:ubiquinone biosynthesis protein UbiJ